MAALVTADDLAKVIGVAASDTGVQRAAAAASAIVLAYLVQTPGVDHSEHPADCEVALSVAVSIFQARTASGGQVVGLDYTPTPFRMGPALLTTVSGLVGPCLDQASDAG